MKEPLKLGFTLAVFSVISCVSLAFVNSLTASVIAEKKMTESAVAIKQVFAEAKKFEPVENFQNQNGSVVFKSVNLAKDKDGSILGVVVEATGPTYDKALILVGVDISYAVTGTAILELTDTPGFGQKAKEGGYMDQYRGKTFSDDFVVGKDIAVISGATISAKGIAEIVKAAVIEGKAVIEENAK